MPISPPTSAPLPDCTTAMELLAEMPGMIWRVTSLPMFRSIDTTETTWLPLIADVQPRDRHARAGGRIKHIAVQLRDCAADVVVRRHEFLVQPDHFRQHLHVQLGRIVIDEVKGVAFRRHAGDGGDEHFLGAGGDQSGGVGDSGGGDVDVLLALGDEHVVHAAQRLVEVADVAHHRGARLLGNEAVSGRGWHAANSSAAAIASGRRTRSLADRIRIMARSFLVERRRRWRPQDQYRQPCPEPIAESRRGEAERCALRHIGCAILAVEDRPVFCVPISGTNSPE